MKTFIVLSWLCVLSACGGGAGASVDADQSQGVQRVSTSAVSGAVVAAIH